MLRLPSVREIADLFFTPATVAGAAAMLDRAKARVEAVAQRCEAKAKAALEWESAHLEEAARHSGIAKLAKDELARAERVAGRLADLLA